MRRRLRYSTTFLPLSSLETSLLTPPESMDHKMGTRRGKATPAVREDHVHDHLRNLNIHKSWDLMRYIPDS